MAHFRRKIAFPPVPEAPFRRKVALAPVPETTSVGKSPSPQFRGTLPQENCLSPSSGDTFRRKIALSPVPEAPFRRKIAFPRVPERPFPRTYPLRTRRLLHFLAHRYPRPANRRSACGTSLSSDRYRASPLPFPQGIAARPALLAGGSPRSPRRRCPPAELLPYLDCLPGPLSRTMPGLSTGDATPSGVSKILRFTEGNSPADGTKTR